MILRFIRCLPRLLISYTNRGWNIGLQMSKCIPRTRKGLSGKVGKVYEVQHDTHKLYRD